MTHVVEPDRLIAGWWSVVTLMLTLGSVWLVVDSGGHWLFLALLAASSLVFGWFGVQVVRPQLTRLVIDDAGLRGRILWWSVDLAWDSVHLVRIDRLIGDPVLEITRAGADGGARVYPLPVGVPLPALHAALAATLGGRHEPPDPHLA